MSGADNPDLSHYCRRGLREENAHRSCDGELRGATGSRWWCVCLCHPDEPTPPRDTSDSRKALARWRKQRAVLTTDGAA